MMQYHCKHCYYRTFSKYEMSNHLRQYHANSEETMEDILFNVSMVELPESEPSVCEHTSCEMGGGDFGGGGSSGGWDE